MLPIKIKKATPLKLHLEEGLKRRLILAAEKYSYPLNGFIKEILVDYLNEQDKKNKI